MSVEQINRSRWMLKAPIVQAHATHHDDGALSLVDTCCAGNEDAIAMASWKGEPMLGVFNSGPSTARAPFKQLVELRPEITCFGHGDPLLADAASRLDSVVLH